MSRDGYFFGRNFKIYSVLPVDSLAVSKTFCFLLIVVIFNLDFCLLQLGVLASTTKGSMFAPASVADPD